VIASGRPFNPSQQESIGSSTDMKAAGSSPRRIITLWTVVAGACKLATLGGYAISRITTERFEAAVDGFAAGALLVMLVGSMIPRPPRRRPRTKPVWPLSWGSR
jgi:zinc transporter ZupT